MKSFILILAISALFSCNNEKIDTQKEGEKLMQLSREWSQAAEAGDLEKTIRYWSNDAIFISSGQPTLNNQQEIKGMVEGMYQIPGFKISWEPISVSVSESGDMAYMIEKNRVTYNDSIGNPITTTGRAVTIWKKNEMGEWKNVVEISADDPK